MNRNLHAPRLYLWDMSQSLLRILLVDDAIPVREALRESLAQDGRFEVIGEAANGRQAIDLAAIELPDAMILDLEMPVLGGLEAIPEIRLRSPATKILIFSVTDPDSALRAGALADGFVQKGVAYEVLESKLLEMCS